MVRGTLLGISKRAAAPTQAGPAAISSLNIQANQLADIVRHVIEELQPRR